MAVYKSIGREIRRVWRKPREWQARPGPGVDRQYSPDDIFRAILARLWVNYALRDPLPSPMPGIHPSFLRLHEWAETGELQRMWAEYLVKITPVRRDAWRRVFEGPNPKRSSRAHAYWYVDMKKTLTRIAGRLDEPAEGTRAKK